MSASLRTVPEPTTDLDRAKVDLAESGYCLVAEALPAERLAATRSRLVEVAAAEREAGTATIDGGGANQRVWQLLNKGQEFIDIATHPTALEIMKTLVGHPPFGMAAADDGLPEFLLSNIAANIAGPGGLAMGLHADQLFVAQPWPPFPLAANVMWMLDDFTESNGATLVVPGSHVHSSMAPPDAAAAAAAIPAEAPAGTAMVFEGRLWHGTGANTTTDQHRHGILAYYCPPWMRQQENNTLSVLPEVRAGASPVLRRLMGFDAYLSYGMIDGKY